MNRASAGVAEPPAGARPRRDEATAGTGIHPGAELRIRAHDRITEVEPSEWDEILSPEDLQVSHRFVRICEESGIEAARYRHVTVKRSGRTVAVASLCAMTVSLDLLSTGATRAAIRAVRRVRPRFLELPVVLCGLPVSFGGSCVRIRAGEDPEPIVAALAAEAEAFAAEVGARLVCFKELTSREALAFESLVSRGYVRAPSLPYCTLPVAWRSYEGYLGAMRSGYRRQVRESLETARAAALTATSVPDFGPECRRIFPLYEQVMDRAEFQLERLNLRFFEQLAAGLGDRSEAVLVEDGDRLVAAAIVLHTPRSLTFLLAGIDDRRNRATGAYPFLVAELVRRAIARGASTLELGQTSYALKGRLGAVADPRWLFVTHRSGVGRRLLRVAAPALFPMVEVPRRRVFGRDVEGGSGPPSQPRGRNIAPGRWRDLTARARVAAFGLPAVFGLLVWPDPWVWATAVALAGAVAAWECMALLAPRRSPPLMWSVATSAFLVVVAICAVGAARWQTLGPPVILAWATAGVVLRAIGREPRAATAGAVLLATLVCGALPAHLALSRWSHGSGWVLLALGIAWGGAAAAYLLGRALGGPRLAPRLSPGKTVAGACAGAAAAVAAGLLFLATGATEVNRSAFWLVVAIGAVLAQTGDLAESWLKRRAGARDSGTLLAAQGGVLDSLDGLILLAPWLFFAHPA